MRYKLRILTFSQFWVYISQFCKNVIAPIYLTIPTLLRIVSLYFLQVNISEFWLFFSELQFWDYEKKKTELKDKLRIEIKKSELWVTTTFLIFLFCSRNNLP